MSNKIPQQSIPMVMEAGTMAQAWFRYFSKQFSLLGGQGAALITVAPTGSPFVYQPTSNGHLIISGGTVSAIAYSRDGATYYSVGQIAGLFPMFALDYIKVTYTVVPTVVFVP